MLSRKTLAIASLCTIVCIVSGRAGAEDFKSSKFLTYPADAQKSYIGTAAVAATVIASLNSPTQAKCMDEWVARYRDGGYQPVLDAMQKYPDDHPVGLVLAVLQKACGSLKYAK